MVAFVGSSSNDIFTGGEEADDLSGEAGDDTLSGSGGADTLTGGTGADVLSGGAGDDRLFSQSADTQFNGGLSRGVSYDAGTEVDRLSGGDGDDFIFAGAGDIIDGGASGSFGNRLYISFLGATGGVQADFRPLTTQTTITIGGTSVSNIQNIGFLEGSNFDDLLVPIDTFYPSGASVFGLGGNDRIIADYYSGFGATTLSGGDGDDIIDGRPAGYGPTLQGDDGNDVLYAAANSRALGGAGDDTIYGGTITDGGSGNDRLIFANGYSFGLVSNGGDGQDEIDASAGGSGEYFGGAGADTITGSGSNDTIGSANRSDTNVFPNRSLLDDTGAERDVIRAGAGDDLITAGIGDDIDGGDGSDTLSLSLAGAGEGVVISIFGVSGSATTIAGTSIRNVEVISRLRATEFNDIINIGTQDSLFTVDGGAGDDTIFTNNSSVAANGGAGNDRFVSGAAGDQFNGGEGIDTVDYREATGGVTVRIQDGDIVGSGAGGDSLMLIENVDGSAFADDIIGNDAANRLSGGAGDDSLAGRLGGDTLVGGTGNDRYVVGSTETRIIETVGEGTDTALIANQNYLLNAGASVEILRAAAGTLAINIGGNEQSQRIEGNDGSNILSSGGGGGVDTMAGGLGDDTYRVFATGDVIEDTSGFDTVYASGTSYFLYSTAAVEYLSNSDQAGTEPIYLVGNGASQVIAGNFGNNVLNGRGGDGQALPDTLIGLFGDDTYGVFSQGDVVREVAGQGNDVVFASASYQLRTGTEVEGLAAIDGNAADAGSAYTLRGNEFGQSVVGNNAANVLDGRGGSDVLVGYAGADTFAFTSALGTGNVDTIRDFAGEDRIGLASDIFAALTDGGITAGEFMVGTAAADADDRLVYDQTTGRLFYDADGSGAGAAVLFAQLNPGTQLTAASFVVVQPVGDLPAM